MPGHHVRKTSKSLAGAADDGRGTSVPGRKFKRAEGFENGSELGRIHADYSPAKGLEAVYEFKKGENKLLGVIELAAVLVHQHAEVVEPFVAGKHDRFPDQPLLKLSVAGQTEGIESGIPLADQGEPLGDREPLAERTGGDGNAGENGARVTVEDGFPGPGVLQDRPVKVAYVGINGG
jgi:hypothetical protein